MDLGPGRPAQTRRHTIKFLIALLIPPLYFLLERRWLACLGNSTLYALAWMTVWFMGIGLFFWFLAATHAMWHVRKELMQEQAEAIGREVRRQSAESPE